MAEEHTDEQTMAELKEAFSKYGAIKTKNVGSAMMWCGRYPSAADPEVQEKIKAADTDGNGTICFKEFLALVSKIPKDAELDKYKADFKDFDIDGSGFMTAAELKKAMPSLTDDYIASFIGDSDFNDDSQVNYEEFVKFWKEN